MKKRRTPVGLILGLVVVLSVIVYVNISSHEDNTPKPATTQTSPSEMTADDLKSKLEPGLKAVTSDTSSPPVQTAPAAHKHANPAKAAGTSMLLKPQRINPALVKPVPRQDFSNGVVGGWYNQESGVPKPASH